MLRCSLLLHYTFLTGNFWLFLFYLAPRNHLPPSSIQPPIRKVFTTPHSIPAYTSVLVLLHLSLPTLPQILRTKEREAEIALVWAVLVALPSASAFVALSARKVVVSRAEMIVRSQGSCCRGLAPGPSPGLMGMRDNSGAAGARTGGANAGAGRRCYLQHWCAE
jgi:hypothetical protein